MKNKNLLDRIDEFQKLAKNAKQEFIKKLSQNNVETSFNDTLNYKGLSSLLSSIKSKLNECQRLSMNFYYAVEASNDAKNNPEVKKDVSKISKVLTSAQQVINNVDVEGGNIHHFKLKNVAGLLRNLVNNIYENNNLSYQIDTNLNSLIKQLKATMAQCAGLIDDIAIYSNAKPRFTENDTGGSDVMSHNALDEVRSELYNLKMSSSPTTLQVKSLEQKIESIKSSIPRSDYYNILQQLQNIKTKIQNQLKGGPAVKQKPQV